MKKYAGKNSKFFLVDNPSISTKDVEVLIKEAKKKMGVDYLICTLDLATMLTDMGEKPSEIEQSMNRLSAIAKKAEGTYCLYCSGQTGELDGKQLR